MHRLILDVPTLIEPDEQTLCEGDPLSHHVEGGHGVTVTREECPLKYKAERSETWAETVRLRNTINDLLMVCVTFFLSCPHKIIFNQLISYHIRKQE